VPLARISLSVAAPELQRRSRPLYARGFDPLTVHHVDLERLHLDVPVGNNISGYVRTGPRSKPRLNRCHPTSADSGNLSSIR
jgi:hypothetical protein